MILAGGRSGVEVADIEALSAATGWPVLADPLSGCRRLATAITAFDAMLRVEEFAAAHRPDVVVRVGRPAASKVLATWVAASAPTVLQVGGPGVIDPDHLVAIDLPASSLAALPGLAVSAPGGGDWLASWTERSAQAEQAIAKALAAETQLSEPGVARAVADNLPDGARLVVASSMPVRDLEWFGGPAAIAHANRGANGIDGVLSTALGVAIGGTTTVALVGDIAFLHDSGALTALARRGPTCASSWSTTTAVASSRSCRRLRRFPWRDSRSCSARPTAVTSSAVAHAHGLDATTVATSSELADRLGIAGPAVTRVATDRAINVTIHDSINAAVADAIRGG